MSFHAITIADPLESSKEILRYLAGTLYSGLLMQSNFKPLMNLEGFCDANWASDPYNRSSSFGFCVYLGSNLISWQSKRQHVVSRPSIKVEYKSLAHLGVELT